MLKKVNKKVIRAEKILDYFWVLLYYRYNLLVITEKKGS